MTKRIEYKIIDGVTYIDCLICGEESSQDNFRAKRIRKDGSIAYTRMCKSCENKKNLERHYRLYRDNQHARKSSYRYNLKKYYGIDESIFTGMYNKQGGLCAICKHPVRNPFVSLNGGKQAVDHCHTSGKVREILCYTCNVGLGSFQDSPELLRDAAKYIERHRDVIL
jgi:hypothetical protein